MLDFNDRQINALTISKHKRASEKSKTVLLHSNASLINSANITLTE